MKDRCFFQGRGSPRRVAGIPGDGVWGAVPSEELRARVPARVVPTPGAPERRRHHRNPQDPEGILLLLLDRWA